MNIRVSVAIVMSILLVGSLIPVGAVGGPPASTPDSTAGTVDSELATATGEQTIIVRLTDRQPAAIDGATHEQRVETMRSHAATVRTPFEQFANSNPHVEIDREFWLANALVVTVDTDRVPLQRLVDVEHVERVHPNYAIEPVDATASAATIQPSESQPTPTYPQISTADTGDETTYGLQLMNVPSVWDQTKGEGTKIAVLDTGVDPDHPDIDIDPANWNDWETDGTERSTTPQDYGSHGTHVSGTAVGGSASGVHIGVAPDAELYHGAALNQDCDTSCGGTVAQVIAGMEWAVEEDVDVISMSLGRADYIDEFIVEVRNAEAAGVVVVAAAGNSGDGTSSSPGNVYDAISVGATDQNDNIADFSSSESIDTDTDWEDPPADWPDEYTVPTVAAPGVATVSAIPNGEYAAFNGTSMATPHVSGTVALMQASTPDDLTPAEIRSALETTAVDTGDTQVRQGAGRIDAAAAVAAVTDDGETDSEGVFEITSFSATPEVMAGDTVTLSATITNTGTAATEQTVTFITGGTTVATETVYIEPDESETLDGISYQTDASDSGTLHNTVSTDDDTATTTTTVINTHESGVDQELWDTVTDQNAPTDTLTYQDLIDVIESYHDTGSIDGVSIEYEDLLSLIEYYQTT